MNPIEALVAQIPIDETITPGILKTLSMDWPFSDVSISVACFGRMHNVRMAVVKSAEPSTTNGK